MDTEGNPEGLVEVRFVGGFLHGRRTFMANAEFRMQLESPAGETTCYCRRMVESIVLDERAITVATYALEGLSEHAFERLVLDAARTGASNVSLD